MKHVVLSPHFDDAVISLGGYLDILGKKATVITFFTSSPIKPIVIKWDNKCGFINSKDTVKQRKIENLKALKILNNNIIDYEYIQHSYRKKRMSKIEEKELINEIEKDINKILNTNKEISLYSPAYLGSRTHKDHKILHHAFIKTNKNNKNQKHKFYIYEDYLYCDNFRIRHEIMKNSTLLRYFSSLYSSLTIIEKTIKLKNINLENKLEAILKYKSQVFGFDNYSDSPMFSLTKVIDYNRKRYKDINSCEIIYQII